MPRRPDTRRVPWAAYLWPGLPHLWNSGSWAGLALAVGFSVLLNVLILSTFAWPEWFAPRVKLVCGLATAVVWVSALWETRGELRRQAARREADGPQPAAAGAAPDLGAVGAEPATAPQAAGSASDKSRLDVLFRQAQQRYLAGEWAKAEQTLRELLRLDRDDIEAQLLLASVWRVADQPERSRRQLVALQRRRDAEAWRHEIEQELKLLMSSDPRGASGPEGGEPTTALAATPQPNPREAIAGRIGDERLPAGGQDAA